MTIEEKVKKIKVKRNELIMVHTEKLDPEGNTSVRAVPKSLQEYFKATGWKPYVEPPVEAKPKTRRVAPSKSNKSL